MANHGRVIPDCPRCEAGVMLCTDSRGAIDKSVLRRRRKSCKTCGYACTTHEVIVADDLGLANSQQARALSFLRDVEKCAREHFGDERGSLAHGLHVSAERSPSDDGEPHSRDMNNSDH